MSDFGDPYGQEFSRTPFRITGIRASSRYAAARGAILNPLLGSTWTSDGAVGVVNGLRRVREMWQPRLRALMREGWTGCDSWTKYAFACNCPPFGVHCDVQRRTCRKQHVCPFCFGRRYPLAAYFHLELALYGTLDHLDRTGEVWKVRKPRPQMSGVRIVDFTFQPGSTGELPFTRDGIYQATLSAADFIARFRQVERIELGATFGVVLHKVYPDPDTATVRMVRGGVMLAEKGELSEYTAGVYEKCGGTFHVQEASKTALVAAVSRAFSYPEQMMFAPAVSVEPVLRGLAKTRTFFKYGRLPKAA